MLNPHLIAEFMERSAAVSGPGELFSIFRDVMDDVGFDVVSYHIVADDLRRVELDQGLLFETFPKSWVDQYVEQGLHRSDPIIPAARAYGRVFRWFEVGDHIPLRKHHRAYLDRMRDAGLTDGLAVPVFSGMGDMAYFALGCLDSAVELSDQDVRSLHIVCTLVHNRFLELRGQPFDRLPFEVSERERQTLELLAAGLSVPEIAERLNVSKATVNTFIKRITDKLGTNSRMESVLRALGAGTILA